MENKSEPSKENRFRDTYLKSGKVPFDIMLKKGVKSLLCDPWFTFIKYLQGPIGFKLRQIYWRRKLAFMGKAVAIDPDVDINGASKIHLDDFVYLGKGAQLLTNEKYEEGVITIGRRSHILCRILGYGGVEIGNYVGIGKASILSATDNYKGGYRMGGPMIPYEQRNVQYGKIVIGDDAFISEGSVIMPGVTIGNGAVVAANSFVNRDIEAWKIVGGSPAKVIGERERVKLPCPD